MKASNTNNYYMCGMCNMPKDIFAMIVECGVFAMKKKR